MITEAIIGGIIGGVLGAFGAWLVGNAALVGRIFRLEQKVYGEAGNYVQARKKERLGQAAAEAMAILSEKPPADATESQSAEFKSAQKNALIGLLGKYPDVALDLVNKHGKDLGGLIR